MRVIQRSSEFIEEDSKFIHWRLKASAVLLNKILGIERLEAANKMLVFWILLPFLLLPLYYFQLVKLEPKKELSDLPEKPDDLSENSAAASNYLFYVTRNAEAHRINANRAWKRSFQIFIAAAWVIGNWNWAKGFLPGWVFLLLVGLIYCGFVYWDYSISNFVNSYLELRISESDLKNNRQYISDLSSIKKQMVVVLIATIALSGNWAWRVSEALGNQKQLAVNETLSLQGEGWCANWSDVTVGKYGDVSKDNGWPCISVGSVANINYSKSGKNLKMCADFGLDQQSGPPGSTFIRKNYRTVNVCNTNKYSPSWDKGIFLDGIHSAMGNDLRNLQANLCTAYYSLMSPDARFKFCSRF